MIYLSSVRMRCKIWAICFYQYALHWNAFRYLNGLSRVLERKHSRKRYIPSSLYKLTRHFSTSAEAVKYALYLEKEKVDLIMLDVVMPDMDGLETLRRIREKYQTPVVLMTGDKTLDTSTEFAELGCDDYVTKPFLPLLIKEVIYNMTKD